jgi:hypothetical protein
MMHRKILVLLLHISIIQAFGQNVPDFHPPLKIPMYLSGNFGEIRIDHFHSGIDIKTHGTTGQHVFAIDDGYVSRIKVQANGYGNSIYLTHPDGYTSVYGHLDRYREDIAAYTRKVQYQRQSHQVDIYLDPATFPVHRGDFIAYSGNSGGSSGPHLHFEVRTSGNQHPTNVLNYGFDIKDHIAPKFQTLFVNGTESKQSYSLVLDNGRYTVPWGTRIQAAGKIGLSVEVFDYLDGVSNKCSVHTLQLYVDDTLVYSHAMDEFSFSETRYVNAHADYKELVSTGKIAHRLYRLPNDRLRIYGHLNNDGFLVARDNRDYHIRIVAEDVAGNQSELWFTIHGIPEIDAPAQDPPDMVKFIKYNEKSVFENDQVRVEIPASALYEDLKFRYAEGEGVEDLLTGFYQIHYPETPLHLPYTLSIKAPDVIPGLRDKLLLVTGDKQEIVSAGGDYKNGWVVASVGNFGRYAISLDTIAPEITPRNGTFRDDLTGRKTLNFTIRDNLSGIEKYEGYIDNRWALFEYDPKNELLTYTFDKERVNSGQLHELELYVSDFKGNVNLFHTTFTW